MDNYVIFTAQNVDDPSSLEARYPSELPNKYYHHSTNRFGRQPFDEREGEPMRLHITGRLRNERVDALVVDNPNSDNEIPHITLATAEGVKPFASNAELKSHHDDIEPLDDYVETTFRNNFSTKKNESMNRLKKIIYECVLEAVTEKKKGGLNYASGGDEFYTREKDVKRELSNYDFTGTVVYCPCDNPSQSNFYKYFKDNYSTLGLKGLYATWYSEKPTEVFYDGREETIRPITSGRFQDNAETMEKCDVVVTNPPFSNGMPSELLKMANGMGKKIIMVGPSYMASGDNEAFDMLKNGKLSMGHTPIGYFDKPDGSKKSAPTEWWTTMPVKREPYHSGKTYDPNLHPNIDNHEGAVNCDSYADIPEDYDGVIAVPWGFLRHHDQNQYEIVGNGRAKIGDRSTYSRVFVRRRPEGFAESVAKRLLEMIKG